MPTYEYECQSCRKTVEKFQQISDPPLKKCPTCGGHLRRLIGTGAGIIFKGRGFYQTDYRSEDYKKKAQEESSSGVSKNDQKSDACKTCPQGGQCPAQT